jgi:hypothetical protein
METDKKDERYFSIKIERSLPLAEQIHQANGLISNEAAQNESVFLEGAEARNGHLVLLYRLGRRENGKKR